MSRKSLIPRYCLHKPSGLARVIVEGKHVYLGEYDSEKSRQAYAQLICERFGNPLADNPPSAMGDNFPDISINELLVRYLDYAASYYSLNGERTKEFGAMDDAVVPLRILFSHLPAREFGPLRLKAIQKYLVDEKRRCRTQINKQVERIRRVFGWAVGEELIPATVHEALKRVLSLRRGKTEAHEAPPVKPVDDAVVDATLPFVSPQIAAMIRVQRLSGARPSEIVTMRAIDIDMADDVWLYRPESHKNSWRDRERVIALGPQAQRAIQPLLDRAPTACLFSPQEAEQWRNEQRALKRNADRKTPIYPCELRARILRKKARASTPKRRAKRLHYDVDSYRRAVKYGIKRANDARLKQDKKAELLPSWHPYQLRHTAGTELRRLFGAEAVTLGLGNSVDLVEVYAERDLDRLRQIARATG